MSTIYLHLHGTKEEIQSVLARMPHHPKNRMIDPLRPIFSHMNEHLGLEIWACIVSMPEQRSILKNLMPVLKTQSEKYPKLLWQVTNSYYEPLSNQHINYELYDPAFPGPFGALCKVYEKTYWTTTQEIAQ